MNKRNYTSIKKIINDIAIKSGNSLKISPDDLLYMANGIVELLIPGDAFVERLALIDITDYKGRLPLDFKYVSQALYRKDKKVELPLSAVTEYTERLYGTDCNINVSLECDPCSDACTTKKVVMDVDYNYLLNNPQWAYQHSKFYYGNRNSNYLFNTKHHSNIFPEFSLMRKTTNNFFNVAYHINECINFNADSKIEYNIENSNIIVNFKKGKVLIAYLGAPVDDEGFRMIPDIEEVYDAIYYTIRERLYEQKFDAEPNQNNRLALQMAMQVAMTKRKRAVSILSTQDPDEWLSFIKNHWVRTIPNYKWEAYGNKFVGDKIILKNHTMPKF